MSAAYRFEGHAIVSADDRIADQAGRMPESLRNDADWRLFQAALDAAVLTVLGRTSHEAARNPRGRRRLVMSSGAAGLERRTDAWWWDPANVPLETALAAVAPEGGTVAVPGGRRVFDYFLAHGFDAFHMARAASVHLPGGVPLFSAVSDGHSAEAALAASGLAAGSPVVLDAGVTLTRWRRPA